MSIFVTGVTTYNRVDFLQRCLESWNDTRDRHSQHTLIVADDGSQDGTLDYVSQLRFQDVSIQLIRNNRHGQHHQINQIYRVCSTLEFDFGFKMDDDLEFLETGWDNAYYEAALATGYHHLCFYDIGFDPRREGKPDPDWKKTPPKAYKQMLCSWVGAKPSYGGFWTFSPAVLKKVGYFDLRNFGLCGLGHVDYTWRCCRAGFNELPHIFDLCESRRYLRLITENYRKANRKGRKKHNPASSIAHKEKVMRKARIFIPYNESKQRL